LDADHVAFGALNQDTLTVLLPTEFRLNQLREKLKHTGVLDLASRHLFGVRRVEGQLRDPARVDARTRHEVRQAREAKRVEALQAEVQRAPFVAALAARLGAEIDSIHEINHATQE
jgi:hypothetical protein